MSFRIALLGLIALVSWGQTKVTVPQLLIVEGFTIKLPNLVFAEGIRLGKIALDSAVFALIAVDGGTVLTIKIPPPFATSTVLLTINSSGTYICPAPPLKVFRNGLIQLIGEDFILNGLVLTMLNDSQPTDKVIVEIK